MGGGLSYIKEMQRQTQCILDSPTAFYAAKEMEAGIKTMSMHLEALRIAVKALKGQPEPPEVEK